MDQKVWLFKHCTDLHQKTVAITGATGGLGREICRGILILGGSLILLNRSQEKTDLLISQLKEDFPDAEITFIPCDLEDLSSVDQALQQLKGCSFQVLLHNAGIYDVPRHRCSTGLDNVFQVNFASPYYMTRKLLPCLRENHCRVTVVGSIAHTYSESRPDSPDFGDCPHCHLVYGNSKRYLMFAMWELFKKETDAEFSIGHPGITLTNISNHYPRWLYPLIRPFLKVFFMSPRQASCSILVI